MQAVSYIVGNDEYIVTKIVDVALVPDHAQLVIEYLETLGDSIGDLEGYKENMITGIKQDNAYICNCNGEMVAFIYCRTSEYTLYGSSLWADGKNVYGTLFLLEAMWRANKKSFKTIKVAPHRNNIKNFMSFATGKSIRAYHAGGSPYIVLPFKTMLKIGSKIKEYVAKYCDVSSTVWQS